MGYSDLLGIIDAEYDVICDYTEEEMIDYLVCTYDAKEDVAKRALINYGLIEE